MDNLRPCCCDDASPGRTEAMSDLRPCCCCDCQHYDPFNDEAPDWCGHPTAPFPPATSTDARSCPGFKPEPYVLAMEFLPVGGATDELA